MFSLMGNCISCLKKKKEPKRSITLAVLGLDCAGKTTLSKSLCGEPVDKDVAPTVGFGSESIAFEEFSITLFDVGGGKKIRGIWQNYYSELYGLIYIVDSTAIDRVEEAKNNLRELLGNPQISGKPVLFLANKQDVTDAIEPDVICDELNLESVVTMFKSPCRIESCSAIKGTGRKLDANIKKGLRWLCGYINDNFDRLKERIDEEMVVENEKRKIEQAAKAERVKKYREEREKKEAEEQAKLGITKEESEDEGVIEGDPFKTLDVNELRKKEEMLKEKKRKKKEMLKEKEHKMQKGEKQNDDVDNLRTPRSTRTFGALSEVQNIRHMLDASDETGSVDSDRTTRSRMKPLLPPIQEPLGTKFVDESTFKRKKKKKTKPRHATSNENSTADDALDTLGEKSLYSLSNADIHTNNLLRNPINAEESEDSEKPSAMRKKYSSLQRDSERSLSRDRSSKRSARSESVKSKNKDDECFTLSSHRMETEESLNSSVLENSELVSGIEIIDKKKQRKKKIRKSQVVQSEDDLELSPAHVFQENKIETLTPRWTFVEDLPDVENIRSDNNRHNIDSDDTIL